MFTVIRRSKTKNIIQNQRNHHPHFQGHTQSTGSGRVGVLGASCRVRSCRGGLGSGRGHGPVWTGLGLLGRLGSTRVPVCSFEGRETVRNRGPRSTLSFWMRFGAVWGRASVPFTFQTDRQGTKQLVGIPPRHPVSGIGTNFDFCRAQP